MAGRMHRSNPGRVALSSSLALLLGAGVPLQQIAAQERPADTPATPASNGLALKQSQGFEMVPGPAPKDVLGARTPETPGANGFELLPSSAESAGAQASAEVNSTGLVSDPSGFQMVPAAETALTVAPQSFEPASQGAPFAPVRAGLPTVQADAADNGFKMLPAAPATS